MTKAQPVIKNNYPFLDGLRTIAILMVFYEHIHFYILLEHFEPMENKFVSNAYFYFLNIWHLDFSPFLLWFDELIHRPSTGQGTLGVDLFFVISGFLITRLLVKDCEGKANIGRFYLHRFLKIYPSYFCLIIGTFLYLLIHDHAGINYLISILPQYLFFFQNIKGQVIDCLTHTWSLVVEEQFYFFYPLIAFFIFKSFSSPSIRRRTLMLIAFVLIGGASFFRYHDNLENSSAMSNFYNFDLLALGCLLALNEKFLQSIQHIKFLGVFFWMMGIAMYLYLTFIYRWDGDGWKAWYVNDLSGIASLNIFLAGYFGVSTFSGLKVVQWLGRHSYGIYLWHLLILKTFLPYVDKVSIIILILLYILISIIAGVLSTWSVEKYFLGLRKKIIP